MHGLLRQHGALSVDLTLRMCGFSSAADVMRSSVIRLSAGSLILGSLMSHMILCHYLLYELLSMHYPPASGRKFSSVVYVLHIAGDCVDIVKPLILNQ